MSDHHGQHSRCRACGTNPRAAFGGDSTQSPEPPIEARSIEMDRNLRRLHGQPPECMRCEDVGVWFDDKELGHQCSCTRKQVEA